MSDLGAIFHVKKDGTQYDAHAYTTTDECPEPNLKIKFKGETAYVKLESKGSGDVPCYVKKRDGGVYQVIKDAVPSGSKTIPFRVSATFTVPKGIKVIKIDASNKAPITYIGVTPNVSYDLIWQSYSLGSYMGLLHVQGEDEDGIPAGLFWQKKYYKKAAVLSWSSEINKHIPDITDYYN